jgi:hypothetical protein
MSLSPRPDPRDGFWVSHLHNSALSELSADTKASWRRELKAVIGDPAHRFYAAKG